MLRCCPAMPWHLHRNSMFLTEQVCRRPTPDTGEILESSQVLTLPIQQPRSRASPEPSRPPLPSVPAQLHWAS